MALAGGDQFLGKGLEQPHNIELAAPQGRCVVGHRPIGDPRQRVGIKPGAAQILLQAEPRRRHLADCRYSRAVDIGQGEIGARLSADQQGRIARHRLDEADQIAVGPSLIHLHDPHRPAPGDVDRAAKKAGRRFGGRRRINEVDVDTLAAIGTQRQCRVIGRVEQAAQRFLKGDGHALSCPWWFPVTQIPLPDRRI
jgi:hypothetical protein